MSGRIRQPLPRSQRGAAMLAALCLAAVFAISLTSYLALCYTSLYVSTRYVMTSFRGSELAEAGVEQALYALNNNDWTGWTLSSGTMAATFTVTSSSGLSTSNGATPLNLGNGVTGTVFVQVQNYSTSPSITSQTTLSLPPVYGSGTALSIPSGSMALSAPTSPSSASAPVFVNAVAAIDGAVRFQSGGTLDSYNSNPAATSIQAGSTYEIATVGTTNWTLIGASSNAQNTVFTSTGIGSGNGTAYQLYSAGVAGYSAVVLSQENNVSTATVRLKNATVHGYAVGYDYSSPSSTNWLSYSTTGKLLGYNSGSGNIDTSRVLTEPVPYQPVVAEKLPANPSSLPHGVGTCSSTGSAIDQSGSLGNATTPVVYTVGNGISLSAGQTLTILGPVVLICYSDVSLSSGAKISLTNPQSSLQIFLEYGNLNIGSTTTPCTGVTNSSAYPLPKKIAIIGTTNTFGTAVIYTNNPFYGVVYLPYMPITIYNTGAVAALYGSIVGQSVTFAGANPVLHYDLALRSPTSTTYSSAAPLQYGAAFDNLSAPYAYGSMALSSQ
jgi:hypothetical protein